jgi:hypothetical protein
MRHTLHVQQPRSLILRRRFIALGSFGATVAAVVIVTATTLGGGGGGGGGLSLDALRTHLVSVGAFGHLARPVAQAAGAASGALGAMLVLGGRDDGGARVRDVQRLEGAGASVVGHLPGGLAGAGAAPIRGSVYLFGGAGPGISTTILGVPATSGGSIRQVARLPGPVTDAAVGTLGGTAFVFGGFDGTRELDSVLAYQPGGSPHRTAHLPAPLRFATATAVKGAVIIAGGISGGAASRNILRFDPNSHRVTKIGQLPTALAHAGAATLGGLVFVVGGRGSGPGSETRAIYAIDPATGASRFAGTLPVGLADAAVAVVGDRILIAGGVNRAGKVQSGVLDLLLPLAS